MTFDNAIREVYVLAVLAHHSGQRQIPVHIFPFPLDAPTIKEYEGSSHFPFWQSLQAEYIYVEGNRQLTTWE